MLWALSYSRAPSSGPISILLAMLRDERLATRAFTRPRLRLGAVLAVALATAFVVWLVTRPGSELKAGSRAASPGTASPGAGARIVSGARLRALGSALGRPLYWAGPRRRARYELTEAADGRTYVRYLPPGAKAGERSAGFLTIGTYPDPNAFARVQAAGRQPGAVTLRLAGGTIAVYSRTHPTSVYLATPRSPVQVEIYDPNARTARKLAVRGQVAPVR